MITYLAVFIIYTGFLCYGHYQYSKVKKSGCTIKWNGYKYIVRDSKGRFKLQAKGRINGLFDIIRLGEDING